MSSKSIIPIFGTSALGHPGNVFADTTDALPKAFEILKKHGVSHLDSAQAYGNSEKILGELKAGTDYGFTIDTKWLGGYNFAEGGNSKENVLKDAEASINRLAIPHVDVFYMHAPDFKTPLKEYLSGVNEAYKAGLFKRFGLSNYSTEEVEKVYNVCKENGFVLPSVYQGLYSAIARLPETTLLPTLRKLGISFYAYSPIAGGFLTKTRAEIEGGGTRFSKGEMFGIYHKLFVKDSFLEALTKWEHIAANEAVSKVEMAYRWIAFNSALKLELGDGLVIGASSPEQLDQTLGFLDKGPLSEAAIKAIDDLWDGVKHDSMLDNFQAVMSRS